MARCGRFSTASCVGCRSAGTPLRLAEGEIRLALEVPVRALYVRDVGRLAERVRAEPRFRLGTGVEM